MLSFFQLLLSPSDELPSLLIWTITLASHLVSLILLLFPYHQPHSS